MPELGSSACVQHLQIKSIMHCVIQLVELLGLCCKEQRPAYGASEGVF